VGKREVVKRGRLAISRHPPWAIMSAPLALSNPHRRSQVAAAAREVVIAWQSYGMPST